MAFIYPFGVFIIHEKKDYPKYPVSCHFLVFWRLMPLGELGKPLFNNKKGQSDLCTTPLVIFSFDYIAEIVAKIGCFFAH